MHRSLSTAVALLAAALLVNAREAEAASLTRTPYLQKVGPDTATVAFRLSASCTPEVQYSANGSATQVARSTASGTVHAVALSGLQPATDYTYVVSACGAQTAAKHFKTAPVPGTRGVHFAAVGDMGNASSQEKQVAQSVLQHRPDLYLTLGDNAYDSGTESEFQSNFFAPMADLLAEVPLFASPGNHEYVTNEAQPYLDNLYLPSNNPAGTERYYSFDWGHVHFVALDSNCAIGLASTAHCTLAAMKAWTESDLSASPQPWKVVFFHHPPWSSGEHGSQLQMRREFGPLFEKYGVDLVLTGHDHNYERSQPMVGDGVAPPDARGVPYLVVGSGGAALRAWPGPQPAWSVVRDNTNYGYLDVQVQEGALTARMVTPSGTVFDSFTLTKELPPQESAPETAPDAGETPPTDGTAQAPAPPSVPSMPEAGTPDVTPPVDSGQAQGGCNAAPVALLPAGMVGLGSLLRRRRRQGPSGERR